MELDTRMLLGVALSALVMAVVFYFQARSFPLNIKGIRHWSLAFALLCCSMLTMAAREVLPEFFHRLVSAALMQGGLLSFYAGQCQFQGRKAYTPWLLIPMVLNLAGMAYFLYVMPLLWARVVFQSYSNLLLLLPSLLLVLRGRVGDPRLRFSKLYTAAFLFLVLAVMALRGTWALFNQPMEQPRVAAYTYEVLTAFFPILVIVMATGIMLLAFDRLKDELEYLVSHDALTGAYSRRGFLNLAEAEISRSLRMQRHTALLVLDLDHFKEVNDRYGHPAGDMVLRKFTDTAKTCLRREDLLGRFGGEEFMVLLPDTSPSAALVVAERIRMATAATRVTSAHHHIRFTVSIGIANIAGRGTLDELLKLADGAMYQAKARGRNRVEVA